MNNSHYRKNRWFAIAGSLKILPFAVHLPLPAIATAIKWGCALILARLGAATRALGRLG